MVPCILGEITQADIVYFVLFLLLVLFGLGLVLIYNYVLEFKNVCLSPYTEKPLRSAADIHWMTAQKVHRYLYELHDYYNPLFDLRRAALCRDTGRLFPDAYTWYGVMKVDWSFIQKKFPGQFVSWGSLSDEMRIRIIDRHGSLEGFQTEFSSSHPSPLQVEPRYAYAKPGPLYVDTATGVLLGWKCVPGTELEVLVVQKPQEHHIPKLN